MTSPIDANKSILSVVQHTLLSELYNELGQQHLFDQWQAPGNNDAGKLKLADQLMKLDAIYPDGLRQYIANSVKLLADSKAGKNPFDGFKPTVPVGERLTTNTEQFHHFETKGMEQMASASFVLVAGGLGERLGYKGIKVVLPTETTTDKCYLQMYCEFILALQQRARVSSNNDSLKLPLAIMTSGDTHDKTLKLLEDNDYFGMRGQLTLMKQELVPAVMDNTGKFVLKEDDPFLIQTKPHGHGDVHTLLHTSGTAARWVAEGRKWVCFFQDTNGLVFRAFPAAVGVSAENDFEVNSLTVPRKPGEAVGGICTLKNEDKGTELTVNVEYNQLDPLLRATVSKDGDVADESGFSPYPGNINVLVFKLQPYAKVLDATNGSVPEFVNPKYKDDAKEVFKKPTRLECMMQDYPKLLKAGAKVGFTQMERFISFSAVKNNPVDAAAKLKSSGFAESASSGESDMYKINRMLLNYAGVNVKTEDLPVATFLGLPFENGARVVLAPSFGCTINEIKQRFPTPDKVVISDRSSLVLDGDIVIHSLNLDGDLKISAKPGAKVVVKSLSVSNEGSELEAIPDGASIDQKYAMRGYTRKEKEIMVIDASKPGETVIEK